MGCGCSGTARAGPRRPHFADAFAVGRAADPAAEVQLVALAQDDTLAPIVRATAMALPPLRAAHVICCT